MAYWVLGLPLGYVMAFEFGWAEKGVWIGLLTGLTITAVMLFYRFHQLSKKKISQQSIQRLQD